ncbi:aminotransferase class I/II-fold pyridoxal phosphate-dependent enzyme [Candidatus Tisiphia endosymbiont of Stenodema calcarata]|uniref:aminotransferase class I/II-fold pyridoxal phosphate-dependent enzyme n=1 Tax=Candidatus Tisiphia endosymbiont of Stenodema calcarata TaxID=3139337 RepID=UPI003CCAC21B
MGDYLKKTNSWLVHDEVYDTMDYGRSHIPARAIHSLSKRYILINSFFKKFGLLGLRIGWMIANEEVINLATKAHNYLYLRVNIQYEKIAKRLISDTGANEWLIKNSELIHLRAENAITTLGVKNGFSWDRKPHGAMFLFPNVSEIV